MQDISFVPPEHTQTSRLRPPSVAKICVADAQKTGCHILEPTQFSLFYYYSYSC